MKVEVGMNELDKFNVALAKRFLTDQEVQPFYPNQDIRGVPAFSDLQQAYIAFTGDNRVNGQFLPARVLPGLRACMNFNSISFPNSIANLAHMILSPMHKAYPYHEDILISQASPAKDLRLIQALQYGGFPDLEDIDPEAGDYQRFPQTPESSADYEIGQKGNVWYITRKMIINDLVGAVKAIIRRAGMAAMRTHARYAWNFFINNSTCPDGTAWFTIGHGNLGVVAISISNAAAAITALANMEESGSGEKVGFDISTAKWFLVVGISQWQTAVRVNQLKDYYTANDVTTKEVNPCYHLFGEKNERIIVCPFITDNDWGVVRDKEDVPILEMSYLGGREEPEFIISDDPKDEPFLVSDKYAYKVRHEYGGVLAGYQGGYKSTP